MNIKVDLSRVNVDRDIYDKKQRDVDQYMDYLWSDKETMARWVKSPMGTSKEEIDEILNTAVAAQDTCGLFIVIGNGGSVEGIKAVIEAADDKAKTAPEVIFVGESLSPFHYQKVIEKMRHYEINVCVISRTGETIETLVSYKVIRDAMVKRYGEEMASKRTIVLTGPTESTLRNMALEDGSGIFDIPIDFAGCFSVMSPASLFPMAVAGIDIKRFLEGAEVMATTPLWDKNLFYYSIVRAFMARLDKKMELIKVDDMSMEAMSKFICQLFSETQSGAKEKLFAKEMSLSRDIMSMIYFIVGREADYLQTEIFVEKRNNDMELPFGLKGRVQANSIGNINEVIGEKIAMAYKEDAMEKVNITLKDTSAFSLGQFVYFMLMSGVLSGYLLGSEPFSRKEVKALKKLKLESISKE